MQRQRRNDQLIGAVLNADSLRGRDRRGLMVRHSWAKQRHAPDMDRLDRLGKALGDTKRAGTLSLNFVDGLTDAKLIAAAKRTAKAAADALASAKSA